MDEADRATAIKFFNVLLDRKKLSKNNELSYNKDNGGCIEQISGLIFNVVTRKFLIVPEVSNKTVKKLKKKE